MSDVAKQVMDPIIADYLSNKQQPVLVGIARVASLTNVSGPLICGPLPFWPTAQ